MQKSFFILVFSLFFGAVSSQIVNDGSRYAQNSVLKSGKWVKIAVEKSGIYKLTYNDLVSAGITNPANVRIFGYGGALLSELFTAPYIDDLPEVAIYMDKGADGVFNAGDYILFYAQGVVSWSYGIPPSASSPMFYHTLNHYSKKGYYFITSDAGTGKKIPQSNVVSETYNGDIVEFTHYDTHESELVNLAGGGREFYGEEFNSSAPTQTYTFNTANLLGKQARIRLKAANRSRGVQANISVVMNNQSVSTISISGDIGNDAAYDSRNKVLSVTPNINAMPTNMQTIIKLSCSPVSANVNLDLIDINVKRKLIIDTTEFYFRNIDYLNQNQVKRFVAENANAATQIWDITDKANIKRMAVNLSHDTIAFIDSTRTLREYLAINPNSSFPKPEILGVVANQNLHALPQSDFVIIANADFLGEAERLAEAHRQKDGLKVAVVDAQKVYNEFSSGTPEATAYRRFVKMFYDRAVSDSINHTLTMPKYLLLFGDGSYDNRGLLNRTTEPIRRLLTYQAVNSVSGTKAYVSDDYFGYLDDNTGTAASALTPATSPLIQNQLLNIGVGRFPVYTAEQAKTLVDKTIHYMNNDIRGSWKNQMVYMADDGNSAEHAKYSDQVAQITADINKDFLVRKLYFDAYKQVTSAAGERYPDVERLLDNYIKNGALMINYMGHGSMNNLASEQILTKAYINRLVNDKYPIFVTATCDYTGFDQFEESAGEHILWNKHGGSMALFTTTRTVYSTNNFTLNKYFAQNIFDRNEDCEPLALGDILKLSKNQQTNTENKFSFILVGDPALKLIYPHEGKVITDSINFQPIDALMFDTISALGTVHLAGHIVNCYGDNIQGFNGYVTAHVFDKQENITTLANPGNGADETNINFTYQDRPNPIFSGSAEVKNGKFKIDFVVPRDIRYNFGTGRIVYYASEDNLGMEANGHFEDFIIGGETANIDIDTIGPNVHLYMNLPEFKNGGKVNTSPLFVAEVQDKSGINTIGSGLGHDMIMRISGISANDGKKISGYDNEEIVLNNYYTSALGSYQKGKVEYQLTDLEQGNYTLKFRVWDMFNNSTNAELRFIVSTEGKIDANVDIFPNPANGDETITFQVTHDRPNQLLNIGISVYDLVGRVVWREKQETITTGTTTNIQWNPANKLAQGWYVVRLELSTPNEKSAVIPKKLLIRTQ